MEAAAPVIDAWLDKHRELYLEATRHPFVLGMRDGSVEISAFKRWLGQDYIFVRAFIPFTANLLLKAWKESDDECDVDVILGGMAALNDEIAWFKKEADKWNVALQSIVPQSTNLDYCRYLESLSSPDVEYTQAIAAFWAIESVYQQSFAHCLEDGSKTPEELREACQRWGNDGFGQYCSKLKSIANRRLQMASHDVLAKTEDALLCILDHEVKFWNMSHSSAV